MHPMKSMVYTFSAAIAGVFFSLLCPPCPADAQTPPAARKVEVVRHVQSESGATVVRLSNGMAVVVRAVRTAPVVTVRAYVRAGGLYEGQWLGCGLSHLVEHLMAKDTLSCGKGQAGQDVPNRADEIGGQANAYTSLSHTCYYISASAEKVNECIDLIADQMARPDITPADFKREHGVVQRELEMGKDDPNRILYYAHQANLYQTHPAAVPVIGYAGPLSRITPADVQAYHGEMYVPQNMVFVVVGDIDPASALERVVLKMQGFEQGRSPRFTLPTVQELSDVRRVSLRSKAFKETAQCTSFQTISLFHGDLYALDVLSHILSQGRASRLVRQLQYRRGIVTSIESWSATPAWGRGNFTIKFRCKPADADAATQAVLAELREVIEKGVSEDELVRARRQKLAEQVRSQQTVKGIASTMGSDLLSTADADFSMKYTRNIQKVSAEQVRSAAKKYFRFDRMAITRVDPAGAAGAATESAPRPRESAVEVYTLPNGMRVVLKPSKAVGLVSMALACRGGLMLETPETNGLGRLMMDLCLRGAGGRSAEQITAFFNSAGGSIRATCGDNSFLWQAEVLSDKFDEALDVLSDVVIRPEFKSAELKVVRPLAVAAVKRVDEHWREQLKKFFRSRFFTGSPWQMLADGSIPVIEKATAGQLADYYRKVVRAEASVLAIYGNFDPADARKRIARQFASMPAGPVEIKVPRPRQIAPEGELHVMKSQTRQAGIIVAAPGLTMDNTPDRLALMLLDTIISGYRMPSGWLHNELRGKKLVYVVHAYQKTGFAPGAFLCFAGTQPEKAGEVVGIIEKNFRRAADYLPTQKELARAVNTIVTSEVLGRQKLADLATAAALNEIYGLGVDWSEKLRARLSKITPEQVRSAARKYLSGGYVVTVITPQPQVLDKKEKTGTKTSTTMKGSPNE